MDYSSATTHTLVQDHFAAELFDVLEGAFETHRGIFLDNGTSLFDTLARPEAAEAARGSTGHDRQHRQRPVSAPNARAAPPTLGSARSWL